MTPQLVHRYAFPVQDVIEALLGDAVGDCEGWRIRIEGDDVVVDVIAPAPGIVPTTADMASIAATEAQGRPTAVDGPEARTEPEDQPAATAAGKAEPDEPKGGRNAQRAAMLCGDRGFLTFLGVRTADEARDQILRRCRVPSRKFLDHDERAAAAWQHIDKIYRCWADGFDAELDPIGDTTDAE